MEDAAQVLGFTSTTITCAEANCASGGITLTCGLGPVGELLTIPAHHYGMGRPALNMIRMHVKLLPGDVERIDALVGEKGRSKFIREAISQQLDQIAPGDDEPSPPFLEYAGRHEPRLTPSGRAVLLDRIQKEGSLDKMMTSLGYDDPIEFLHALLGFSTLPNRAVSALISQILPKV